MTTYDEPRTDAEGFLIQDPADPAVLHVWDYVDGGFSLSRLYPRTDGTDWFWTERTRGYRTGDPNEVVRHLGVDGSGVSTEEELHDLIGPHHAGNHWNRDLTPEEREIAGVDPPSEGAPDSPLPYADRQGFLDRIAENPLDITGHRVFADWLQEEGDPDEGFRRAVADSLERRLNANWEPPTHDGEGFLHQNHLFGPEDAYFHRVIHPFHGRVRPWDWYEMQPFLVGMNQTWWSELDGVLPGNTWAWGFADGRAGFTAEEIQEMGYPTLDRWREDRLHGRAPGVDFWTSASPEESHILTPAEQAFAGITDPSTIDPGVWPHLEAIMRDRHQRGFRLSRYADDEEQWADPAAQERAAFEAAIDQQPLDGNNHLVFADWLDEHNEPDEAAFRRSMGEWVTRGETEWANRIRRGRFHDFGIQDYPWAVMGPFTSVKVNFPEGVDGFVYFHGDGLQPNWSYTHTGQLVPTEVPGVPDPHHARWHDGSDTFSWRTYRDMEEAFRQNFMENRRRSNPPPTPAARYAGQEPDWRKQVPGDWEPRRPLPRPPRPVGYDDHGTPEPDPTEVAIARHNAALSRRYNAAMRVRRGALAPEEAAEHVLTALRRHGPLPRTRLYNHTRLPRPALDAALAHLAVSGRIQMHTPPLGVGRGVKPQIWSLIEPSEETQ